jgi:hypothetical protein
MWKEFITKMIIIVVGLIAVFSGLACIYLPLIAIAENNSKYYLLYIPGIPIFAGTLVLLKKLFIEEAD